MFYEVFVVLVVLPGFGGCSTGCSVFSAFIGVNGTLFRMVSVLEFYLSSIDVILDVQCS